MEVVGGRDWRGRATKHRQSFKKFYFEGEKEISGSLKGTWIQDRSPLSHGCTEADYMSRNNAIETETKKK